MDSSSTPILINDNGIIRRIMNVIYEKDGSIYFVFPRKGAYHLNRIRENKYSGRKHNRVRLKTVKESYKNPKISFHPGKMIMHVMSEDRKNIKSDYNLYNFEKNGDIGIYFCQILLPKDLSIFDVYNKTKYNHFFTIENVDLTQGNVGIEVIIHNSGYEYDCCVLPECSTRNFLYSTVYDSPTPYTCSFFISTYSLGNDLEAPLISLSATDEYLLYYLDIYKFF